MTEGTRSYETGNVGDNAIVQQGEHLQLNQIMVQLQNKKDAERYDLPPLLRPRRATHFVDREQDQDWLLANLKPGRVVTLCGLGGMGKTALVAEVLGRLAPGNSVPGDFPDGIFFYSFYENGHVVMALEQLALAFGKKPRSNPAQAALQALSTKQALLVFDGAEEADHLERIFQVCGNCAVLVTSQQQKDAFDLDYLKILNPLPDEKAVELVQAWGKDQAADGSTIKHICQHVGNLPLALRLSGRYLALHKEEASEYLLWLQENPLAALDQGRSQQDSIPLLLDRSIARLSEEARQALTIIGLLAPTPFGRKTLLHIRGCSDSVAKQALDELCNYDLVLHLDKNYQVSHAIIHIYANKSLLAKLDYTDKCELSKCLIRVLNTQLSDNIPINKAFYEQIVPHVQVCLTLITQFELFLPEAAYLFTRVGAYLLEQIRYTEAEPLYQGALTIRERVLGLEHPDTTTSLNDLAALYRDQRKYTEAEPLYQRALAIRERVLGLEHSDTATSLNDLASLYRDKGKYTEAEPLYQRALAIRERVLGLEHSDTATSLNDLAALYRDQGKYTEAEPLYQRALAIRERILGLEHSDTATSLNDLAALYRDQGKYTEAEPLYQRALAIRERILGLEHSDTATSLNDLASLYRDQGKYTEAEPLYQRALTIRELVLGLEHPLTATSLINLVEIYRDQGKYKEAEPLYQRIPTLRVQELGPEHPLMATSLINLAEIYRDQAETYRDQGKLKETEMLYQRAQTTQERALAIRERFLGPEHPDIAISLNGLAETYRDQGKYEEAEPLYQRALAIRELALGPKHPDTAISLSNLADLYYAQKRYEEAEPLYQRALAIRELALGPKHPDTAISLSNLADLYYAQKRYEEAKPLYQQALVVFEQAPGAEHPDTKRVRDTHAELLLTMKHPQ